MRKLNKKGFTLVELLAVIVILSVVMLIAVTAVGPLMTRARKGALATEAASLVNAAKIAIAAEQLSMTSAIAKNPEKPVCVDLKWLVSKGYYDKSDTTYDGSVKFVKSTNTYTVWITNKAYTIKGKNVGATEADVTAYASTDTNFATCGAAAAAGSVYCTSTSACALK